MLLIVTQWTASGEFHYSHSVSGNNELLPPDAVPSEPSGASGVKVSEAHTGNRDAAEKMVKMGMLKVGQLKMCHSGIFFMRTVVFLYPV